MDIWCVTAQKGGVGKTFVSVNLAILAMLKGQVATVIDLDPQKSAEKWSELRESRTHEHEPVIVHGSSGSLGNMIEVARREGSDLVVIDTPPVADKAMIFAAAAADLVILPTRAAVLDRFSLEDTLELLGAAKALPKCVILVNGLRENDKSEMTAVRALARKFGVPVVATALPDLPAYERALDKGLGILEHEPKGPAAKHFEAIYRYLKRTQAGLARGKSRR
ncbi:MAG: AAA family ATPase [Hyphomicrobiaceae bacterium]